MSLACDALAFAPDIEQASMLAFQTIRRVEQLLQVRPRPPAAT
jgi:hypothetical protein